MKLYQFYCDYCGYKRITNGTDIQDLTQVKQSPIPRGVPVIDPTAPKTTNPILGEQPEISSNIKTPDSIKRKKRFKCPGCGRLIAARQIKGSM